MPHNIKCRPFYDEQKGGWRIAWFNDKDEPTDKLAAVYETKAHALRAAGMMNRAFSVISF